MYSAESLFISINVILSSCTTSWAALTAENLLVRPQMGMMPSGVGQMLPVDFYRTAFNSLEAEHRQKKKQNDAELDGSKSAAAQEHIEPSILIQKSQEFLASSASPGDQSSRPLHHDSELLPMSKLVASGEEDKDVALRRLPDHVGPKNTRELRTGTAKFAALRRHEPKDMPEKTIAEKAADSAQEGAQLAAEAAADAEIAADAAAKAVAMVEENDATTPFQDPEDVVISELAQTSRKIGGKHIDATDTPQSSVAAALKLAADQARDRAKSLDIAAEAAEKQVLTEEPFAPSIDQNPANTTAMTDTTMSTKVASNAAKTAIEAATTAAQHAQAAQTAVDSAKHKIGAKQVVVAQGETSSEGSDSQNASKQTGQGTDKHSGTPSSGSNSIAVPAQVTQGMHISPAQVKDEADTIQNATKKSESKQKEATQAADKANEVAQEASQVAQEEAAKAAANAVQAAQASVKNAKATIHDIDEVPTDESESEYDKTVANSKAQEAQEAAMRAAAAAKVAQEKAQEAAVRANEAKEVSSEGLNSTAEEQAVDKEGQEVEVPTHGLVFSLVLGLVITIAMLGGLLSMFSYGDELMNGAGNKKEYSIKA